MEDLSPVPRSKQEEEEKGPGFSQYVLNDLSMTLHNI